MKTINSATAAFIAAHARDDAFALSLQAKKFPDVDMPYALQQIQSRQKAQNKLPQLLENPHVIFPEPISVEQCSSELTARYKSHCAVGKSVADLTGGFGVDSFFFAQNAEKVSYVEPNTALCELAQHNTEVLNITNIDIFNETAEQFLARGNTYDTLFVDPSRRANDGTKVVNITHYSPNILELMPQLLRAATHRLIIKISPMVDVKKLLLQLPMTTELHAVAVKNEVKELLIIIDKDMHKDDVTLCAADIYSDRTDTFVVDFSAEAATLPHFADAVQPYLYEPGGAVLKLGAFKSVGERFGLQKLHPHSHLYTAPDLRPAFPGRIFAVEAVFPFTKQALKTHLYGISQMNVAVRNFPKSAEAVKQQLKLQDGGTRTLFATTDAKGKHILVLCKRLEDRGDHCIYPI